ncbi:MAG TPA: ABC transporter ATP-binding protein [Xanthobacteraceae bacterium]|jgi:NitT/TauT family transport system ATP-binding protein|nr:ABC transporter ATP-binding protein [Xanthobacteraceae bacterium]
MAFELVVSGLSHRYGALSVLEDISFTIRQGEILAIVGPSGCGKSTLLGIAGGLLRPTAGTVSVAGAMPASLNPFTYIFQDFALLPWRSVAANVRLPIEHHPVSASDREKLVSDALARTGLSEFAGALPKQLSGGMRQRVGIARALVVRPALLLMDEPFSALDAQTRDLLMGDFEAIWAREKTTAAYVTHNLHEALRMADRIMILRRRPGRIREIVPVPIPRSERRGAAAERDLVRIHGELWGLIREEAQLADREIAHG